MSCCNDYSSLTNTDTGGGGGSGDVVGPASSTDDTLTLWDGTTGKLLKDGVARPTGTIVGTTDTQTLTNKTLTATTNDVAAKSLHSATTVVDVSAATAPTSGQVLTATSSTTATWQTPSSGSGGGALTFISTQSASASASINFTGISSTYDTYMVEFTNVVPATNNAALTVRTSTNGGSSYDSTANDYFYALKGRDSGGNDISTQSVIATAYHLNTNIGNIAGDSASGRFYLHGPSAAVDTLMSSEVTSQSNNVLDTFSGSGKRDSAADVDAFQFIMSSGNITSGTFTLYGVAKSAGGGGGGGFTSGANAWLNTTPQTLTTATWTKIALNATRFDGLSEFDTTTNYRFTVAATGRYFCSFSCTSAASLSDGTLFVTAIRKNNSPIIESWARAPTASTVWSGCASTLDEATAGDYYELWAYHNKGSNVDIQVGSQFTYLAIQRML